VCACLDGVVQNICRLCGRGEGVVLGLLGGREDAGVGFVHCFVQADETVLDGVLLVVEQLHLGLLIFRWGASEN
jgi:hypothetical protein